MLIRLTDDDLKQIEGWYNSAAGESHTWNTAEDHQKLLTLLRKLRINIHWMDKRP